MTLLVAPALAWADHNPDFDDDAKPILRMQPGLLQYVEATYQVRDTGVAKVPGNDDRHAAPPYIFLAKPRGYPGDYYINLLIQPGPAGHILKIVDPTQPGGVPPFVHRNRPDSPQPPPPGYSGYQQQPPSNPSVTVSQAPAKQTTQPAVSSKPQASSPTSDTPSGPIADSGHATPLPPPPSSNSPSLEPPPDPAPASR